MEIAILSFFGVLIIAFFYLAYSFEYEIMRIFFFLIGFGFCILGINECRLLAEQSGLESNIIKMLNTTHAVLVWILYLFLMLFFIYGLYLSFIKLRGVLDNKRTQKTN